MIGWQAIYAVGRRLERNKRWKDAARAYEKARSSGQQNNPNVNYRLGYAYFQAGDFAPATRFVARAVELSPDNAEWQYKLGFFYERQKRPVEALSHYDIATELDPTKASWHYRRFCCFEALSQRDDAQNALRVALHIDPANSRYHKLLADSLKISGPKWQELETLELAEELHSDDAEWQIGLASANEALSRPKSAAQHFHRANRLLANNSDMHYREGRQWELAGEEVKARAAYQLAIHHDEKLNSTILGVGAFHQKYGKWGAAARSYQSQLSQHPSSGELRFRLGLAFDRCFEWADASRAYTAAVALEPGMAYWHYKVGFALERSKQWRAAAEAYQYAAELPDGKPYWFYRAGYCFEEAGYFEEACDAYLRSSPPNTFAAAAEGSDPTKSAVYDGHLSRILTTADGVLKSSRNTPALLTWGELAGAGEDWQTASAMYARALQFSENHDARIYFLLGNSLFRSGKAREAASVLRQSRQFATPDGIDLTKYLKNKAQKNSMEFIEARETLPLDEKTVLWESNHGSTIGCHPLAIFRAFIADAAHADFRHVWVINDHSRIPAELAELPNVAFTKTNSDLYKKTLATAKFLVNNVSFPPYFVRRDGQQYLNTWHGTPFKTLGKDMAGPILQHTNLARNFLQSTHIMSPNEHTSWSLIERHDIEGLYTGKIAVTGSPRLDRMLANSATMRPALRRRLGIDADDTRPVVLFAPTWRGATDNRTIDVDGLLADVRAMTDEKYHLVFRAHRLTEKLLSGTDIPATVVPSDIDTTDLLAAVDVLITDYSSISFDFMPLKRPIVYYTPDFDEYKRDRGLYFDKEELPGVFCHDVAELRAAIEHSIQGSAAGMQSYVEAVERFSPLEDGQASSRVVDFFFNDAGRDAVRDTKKTILFHQSLIPNGIATSFQNLVNQLDPAVYRLVLVVEPEVISADPGRLEKFHQLPEHVQIVGRQGIYAARPEERWLMDRLNSEHELSNEDQWQCYFNAFRREFVRIFGTVPFDAIVEFDGYSTVWCSLMAAGAETARTSVYLHNDMVNEWQMKYADLAAVFRLYRYFGNKVSVSKEIGEVNRASIAPLFELNPDSFTHANNQLNAGKVLSLAKAEIDADLQAWFATAERNFVSIGRLSPEKDHEKLVRAFVKYRTSRQDANLTIIGDGPLKADLQNLISRLGAKGYILLAGQRSNPYPALAAADAFIMSSLHEGQPMVLFEAMILGRKIVCTDMPGPRGVLQDKFGMIVENSEEGLVEGLMALSRDAVPSEPFDWQGYVDDATRIFLRIAFGSGPEQPQDNSAHGSFQRTSDSGVSIA